MDFNKVILGGTLTRDPDLRSTRGGTEVCDLGLAINKRWTDASGQRQESTVFVDVTFLGRTAENVAKYFSKGGQILVEGELKLDQWEDKDTGQRRSKLKVNAFGFQFCNKNEGGDGGNYNQSRDEDEDDHDQSQRDVAQSDPKSNYDEDEDEIPF